MFLNRVKKLFQNHKPFDRNRGEIAIRIARAAAESGIRTAVISPRRISSRKSDRLFV